MQDRRQTGHSVNLRGRRGAEYAAIIGALLLLRQLLAPIAWQGTLSLYGLIELVAATTGLMVGVLALVRHFARNDNTFLFIGTGFVGASLLDAYHAVTASVTGAWLLPADQLSWSWNPSLIFLALLISGSWIAGVAPRHEQQQRTEPLLFIIAGLLLLSLCFFFGLMRLSVVPPLGDLSALVATLCLGVALYGYMRGHWNREPCKPWLIRGLVIMMAAQALFMPLSDRLFDPLFTAALVLKEIGYLLVLAGLLCSMVAIFKQAQQTSQKLGDANHQLQQEVLERRRAEELAQRQRQLAVALREVGIALSAELRFDDLLNALFEQIGRVLPYDHVSIVMITERDHVVGGTRSYGQSRRPIDAMPPATLDTLQELILGMQPIIISDTAADQRWQGDPATDVIRSWAGAPVVYEDQIVALLTLSSGQRNLYQESDAALLAAFAGQTAIAFKNAQLYSEVSQHVANLKLLHDMSGQITASLKLRETLTLTTENAARLLNSSATYALLKRGDKLTMVASAGPLAGQAFDQALVQRCASSRQPLLIADRKLDAANADIHRDGATVERGAALCVPLESGGRIIGVIAAFDEKPQAFNENDLRLLTLLARPAATAVENARLYGRARQEIIERQRAEEALEAERASLAARVRARTAELQAANEQLRLGSRLKDEFLASMSHELRTPLNSILGMAQVMNEGISGPLSERQQTCVAGISESGTHLLSIINDILDISKIEAGKLELALLPVSLEAICTASIRFIRHAAEKKNLDVQLTLDAIPPIVMADERRIKQILINLLSNAVKFTSSGSISLHAETAPTGDAVLIHVKDSGLGIPEDDLERLFQPFVQLDSRLSRNFNGTGLGLALVRKLTELHGGTVSVASTPGIGSCFTVSLPLTPAAAGDPANRLSLAQPATKQAYPAL